MSQPSHSWAYMPKGTEKCVFTQTLPQIFKWALLIISQSGNYPLVNDSVGKMWCAPKMIHSSAIRRNGTDVCFCTDRLRPYLQCGSFSQERPRLCDIFIWSIYNVEILRNRVVSTSRTGRVERDGDMPCASLMKVFSDWTVCEGSRKHERKYRAYNWISSQGPKIRCDLCVRESRPGYWKSVVSCTWKTLMETKFVYRSRLPNGNSIFISTYGIRIVNQMWKLKLRSLCLKLKA